MNKTSLLFLWHMHQPFYQRPGEKHFFLPWVRLHAVKDYFPFALLLSEFPQVKATFNFSGVLLEQLLDYQAGASDYYLELSLKNPAYLTEEEVRFICKNFFHLNFERMIKPYPRYLELYNKYIVEKAKRTTAKDLGDLQLYFNLVWFHSLTVEQDKGLRQLFRKGKGFDQNEKEYVLQRQREIVAKVLPLYKRMFKSGQIEISVSPYYHPILPLLCDSSIAKEAGLTVLPSRRFVFPQDAKWHLVAAKKKGEKIFGKGIRGSWPSEGSVSQAVVDMYREKGFDWVATDEDILFRSLSQDILDFDFIKTKRELIYRPYRIGSLKILFRDKNLSDAIGFSYHRWQSQTEAASDFLKHCKDINAHLGARRGEGFILIAMDGENAWEYYEDNARSFFQTLYRNLSDSPQLKTDTISGFLAKTKEAKELKYIASGSWINADFSVWIGSPENNYNWHLLQILREAWEKKKDKISTAFSRRALSFLYIIEGSDWNWWNTFQGGDEFKSIFLSYLRALLKILKVKIPHQKEKIV